MDSGSFFFYTVATVESASSCHTVCMYVCMYVWFQLSMDQPGKVANPAHGQLNRENGFYSVPVRA